MSGNGDSAELAAEQGYLDLLYRHLDAEREYAQERLTSEWRRPPGGAQNRTERDLAAARYAGRIAQLNAVEDRLCFGRLDLDNGENHYVGRLGIFDDGPDGDVLLMDWRAPAARPFYLANAVAREGVRRRRHIRTKGRLATGLDDEVLDLASGAGPIRETPTNEAALMAALAANRTGEMTDIVATIQAEQDRIIRSDINGVLVVQGGPGTGKTAIALHRVAYLLYTHRERLEKRGVLVLGPNPTFLGYISQVLPSLGETGALLRTVGGLYPGLVASGVEAPEVAEVKGRAVMADVLAAAVRDRQEEPELAKVPFKQGTLYEAESLLLTRAEITAAGERARATRQPHNIARSIFVEEILTTLTQQLAGTLVDELAAYEQEIDESVLDFGDDGGEPTDLLHAGELAELNRNLREDPGVQAAIDGLWPRLTPQRLLADLYASPERIDAAAAALLGDERSLLGRDASKGWSPTASTPAASTLAASTPAASTPLTSNPADWTAADVPLLDEAAELLGEDDGAQARAISAQRRDDAEYAQGVVDILRLEEDEADQDVLMAANMVDVGQLAERQEKDQRLTTAERAAMDRSWAFGHVVVDEAQELSAMAWRVLMRRCPSRSMTLVGDIAQTSDPGGAASWASVLSPYVAQRWRLEQLTVNYRTPAEIMEVASDVLATLSSELRPPRSVRSAGVRPWSRQIQGYGDGRLAELVERELAEIGEGKLALIGPSAGVAALGATVRSAVPDAVLGDDLSLAARVVVLDVRQAKGLEFDSVLVIDPAGILAGSPRGANDLYVALTRATHRLGVGYAGTLPEVLSRCAT